MEEHRKEKNDGSVNERREKEERAGAERNVPAMARRAGGRGGPRLLLGLWLVLCGMRGGSAQYPQYSRGAGRPLSWGPAAACSPRCLHGGLCLGNGTCLCSKGYEGELCQHGNGGAGGEGQGAREVVRRCCGRSRFPREVCLNALGFCIGLFFVVFSMDA